MIIGILVLVYYICELIVDVMFATISIKSISDETEQVQTGISNDISECRLAVSVMIYYPERKYVSVCSPPNHKLLFE